MSEFVTNPSVQANPNEKAHQKADWEELGFESEDEMRRTLAYGDGYTAGRNREDDTCRYSDPVLRRAFFSGYFDGEEEAERDASAGLAECLGDWD
jgi:hypothetical protein